MSAKRQQSAEVEQVVVLVEMTNKHFRRGIPTGFAETIAKNLNTVGLSDHFRAAITDVSRRSVGRGQIRVIHEGPVSNTLMIAVEPNIANSNQNRFECILYCPDCHPREEVMRALGIQAEIIGEEEEEEISPVQPTIYPNLNEPRYQDELCQILKQVIDKGKDEIPAAALVKIVTEVCGLGNMPERVVGRYVVGKIAYNEDDENSILVIIRHGGGSIRGYRLGQLGQSLMGIVSESPKVETPDPVAYVTELKKIALAGTKSTYDQNVIHSSSKIFFGQTLNDIHDDGCRERLIAAAEPLKKAMEQEASRCGQIIKAGKEAQAIIIELRRLLAES
jgi:hypothetical protein